MVWQERSRIIVMLTRLKENNEVRRRVAPSVVPFSSPNLKKARWFFQKCELYWPQPREVRTRVVKEEQEEGSDELREDEEEGRTGQFGRFVLSVRDIHEKCGFTVTDLEVQVEQTRPSCEIRSRSSVCGIFQGMEDVIQEQRANSS